MRLFRRTRADGDAARARAEREAAERRLEHATEHVIVPLRELREKDRVGEVIGALIARRVQRGD